MRTSKIQALAQKTDVPTSELEAFARRCRYHDWHYQRSDDPGVYRKGQTESEALKHIAAKDEAHAAIYNHFAQGGLFDELDEPAEEPNDVEFGDLDEDDDEDEPAGIPSYRVQLVKRGEVVHEYRVRRPRARRLLRQVRRRKSDPDMTVRLVDENGDPVNERRN